MFILDWISENGSPVDLAMFIMGMGVLFLVLEQRKDVKELRRLYHQTDKMTYGIAIAIQKKTGIKLVKQSANGEGDHALNRDVT